MNRRSVLLGLGATAAGSGIVFGSGAFTQVQAERDISIGVSTDQNALVELKPNDEIPSVFQASSGDNQGELAIDTSKLNSNDAGFNVGSTVQIGGTAGSGSFGDVVDVSNPAFEVINRLDEKSVDNSGDFGTIDIGIDLTAIVPDDENQITSLEFIASTTTYATTSTEQKARRLDGWADEIIDYTETPFDERVMELTDGRGVDLVADHVGQETWQRSIDSLAMGGRMVICGATSGPTPDIDIRSVYQHHRQILGAPMGNRQDFRDVVSLVARDEVTPVIDRVLSLEDVSEGHRAIEGREVFGKVVVVPGR